MNAMTCEQAREQIDLLAAGECDPPTRAAVEQHLSGCAACAADYAESHRLLALLDQHWSEAGIERLRRRIDAEARPVRRLRLFSPLVRRSLAAAAVILIAAGLVTWLPNWDGSKTAEPQLALLVRPGEAPFRFEEIAPAKVRANPPPAEALTLKAQALKALEADLVEAQREGKLPMPPLVSVDLALVNRDKKPIELTIGDLEPTLAMELEGANVVRIAATSAEPPAYLRRQSVHLEPGKQFALHIDRLIAGSPGKLEYIYLTEPGDYTLTVQLRVRIDKRVVTVTGDPVRIKFEK